MLAGVSMMGVLYLCALIHPWLVLVCTIVGVIAMLALTLWSYYWTGIVIGKLAARMSRDAALHATACMLAASALSVIGVLWGPTHQGGLPLTLGVTAVFCAICVYIVRQGSREGVRREAMGSFV